MWNDRLIIKLAQAVHENNRLISTTILQEEKQEWNLLNNEQQQGIIQAVRETISNKVSDPALSHEAWVQSKIRAGWKFGDTYSEDEKTHPNIKPYDQLEPEQRLKDLLYLAILTPFYD